MGSGVSVHAWGRGSGFEPDGGKYIPYCNVTAIVHVLYYLGSFPKLSESFVLNELYELERNGHDVSVFALRGGDEEITHEEYEALDASVSYAEKPGYRDVFDLLSPKLLSPRVLRHGFFQTSPQRHAASLHWAKQCIEFVESLDRDVDHVHTHFLTVTQFPARYVASYFGVPLTMTAHAFDLYDSPRMSHLRHIADHADQLVTISEYNRDYLRREVTSQTPIEVIRAGIRPEKFSPTGATNDSRVLTVGRFVEKKGITDAVRAMASVVDRIPDVEYHVVGDGPRRPEIESAVERAGIEHAVDLLGTVDDDRLVREFNEAACFLLPCVVAESGDRDGIPVVLMEAMAMETPPVSTTVSGIPELIEDGENGRLVPPGDPGAIADAVVELLQDPERRRALGAAGRETVSDRFDAETAARRLEALFERLANGR